MVGHETPSENRERVALVCVEESPLQFVHVFWRAENGLAVVAAHDDVVIGIWVELAPSGHIRSPSDREMRAALGVGVLRMVAGEFVWRAECSCLELKTMLIKIPSFCKRCHLV